MAERPRPLDAGRILVDAIEHAGAAQIAVGGGEAAIDLFAAERGQHARNGCQCARTRPSPSIISSKMPGSGR